MKTAIERAVEAVGGREDLAEKLGVTPQAVWLWIQTAKAGGLIPAERIVDIERETGVSRQELRPDLYQ